MTSSSRPEVVVVTGGGAALGRAIVQSFARRGAHIGLVSRSQERLEDARREVEELGGKAIALPGDVADPATTEEAAAGTEDAFGPIDIWVNDAMTTVFSPFHQLSADDFKRVTEVTYLGFVYGTMAALKGCGRATAGRSSRSAQHWLTGPSRSSRRTAAPSTQSSASPTRSAVSSSMMAAVCISPSYRCPR